MFGFTTRKGLKKVISVQDNTIKKLREELSSSGNISHNGRLEVTRLAAENAVLKQRIINLEEQLNKYLTDAELAINQYMKTGIFPFNTISDVLVSTIKSPKESNINSQTNWVSSNDLKSLPPEIRISGQKNITIDKVKEELKNEKPVSAKLQAWYDRDKNNTKMDEVGCVPQKIYKKEDIVSANFEPLIFKEPKKRNPKKTVKKVAKKKTPKNKNAPRK